MEIIKRTITVHGGQEIYVLMPIVMNQSITCGHDNKGFNIIWANGSGYQFLAECFSIAAELKKNEILYLPTHFRDNDEFNQVFTGFECNFNIVCVNYCETQVSSKDIERVLKVKTYSEEFINRYPKVYRNYPEVWKLYRRLTIKIHKKICISQQIKMVFLCSHTEVVIWQSMEIFIIMSLYLMHIMIGMKIHLKVLESLFIIGTISRGKL